MHGRKGLQRVHLEIILSLQDTFKWIALVFERCHGPISKYKFKSSSILCVRSCLTEMFMGWKKGPSGAWEVEILCFSERKTGNGWIWVTDWNLKRLSPPNVVCTPVVVLTLKGCPLVVCQGQHVYKSFCVPSRKHHPLHPNIAHKKRTECCCINLKSTYVWNYCIAHFRI